MAKDPKAAAKAADEVLPEAAPAREGPSDEEQAMVDAEQRDIMARNAVARKEADAAERANHDGKLERAAARQAERANIDEAVKALVRIAADLTDRVAELEKARS